VFALTAGSGPVDGDEHHPYGGSYEPLWTTGLSTYITDYFALTVTLENGFLCFYLCSLLGDCERICYMMYCKLSQ